ncbi:MAG TPA: cyclic peptide export ABC transporter [Pyrinomonadaceae bacterium]|nr:cyclic peptide export ABC transporter [Pyrinomonadaceae bacterium]
MKLFRFLLRFSPGTFGLSVGFGLISGAANIGMLVFISRALTRDRQSAESVVWLYIALCALMPVTRFISEMVLNYLSQNAIFELRMKLSRKILEAPLKHLEKIGSPRLYATLTEDIVSIASALMFLPVIFINASVVVGCLFYLGWLSFNVLSVLLCFMVVGVVSYQTLLLRSIRYQRRAREDMDVLFKHYRSMTDGNKELKIHQGRREAFITQLLEATAKRLRKLNLSATALFTAAASWGQALFFILIGVVLFAVPIFEDLSAPVMITCTIVILYLMTPLSVTLNLLPSLTKANVALKKVELLGLSLDTQRKNADATPVSGSSKVLNPGWQRLGLVNVSHTYHREQEDESFTLGPLDLEFRPGELVFITGGNGSGKTTLLKLITALYLPEEGEIHLDGEPISQQNVDAFRQQFSVVFSDFHLFETILGIDKPELDAKAIHYLKQLHLENKVRYENGNFSTTELSQGQRKRLALLTAYLEDRSIYVFDEWAADQDPQFKQIFYYELLPALKARGKTVLVITHDDRYFRIADRLIKLENGKLISSADTVSEPVMVGMSA